MLDQDRIIQKYTELIRQYFQALDILVKQDLEINEDLCFDIGKVNDIEVQKCSDFDMAGHIILTKYQIFFLKNFLNISDKKQREIVNGLGFPQEFYFKLRNKVIPYIDIKELNEFRVLP